MLIPVSPPTSESESQPVHDQGESVQSTESQENIGGLNAETMKALQVASESLRAQKAEADERDRAYLEGSVEVSDEAPDADAPAPLADASSEDKKEPLPLSVSSLEAMQRLIEGQQSLEKERSELKPDLELAKQIKALKDSYGQDRVSTVKQMIELMGIGKGDDELQGVFDEYTLQVLGVDPDPSSKALTETRRLRFEIENLKKQEAEAERKRQESQSALEEERHVKEAMNTIGQEIKQRGADYPFLSALQSAKIPGEPNAAQIVWNKISREHEASGKEITLEEALRSEEDRIRATLEPFRDLLTPKRGGVPNESRPSSNGPSTISSSMTNAPAATVDTQSGFIEDEETSRRRSVAMLERINRMRAEPQAR